MCVGPFPAPKSLSICPHDGVTSPGSGATAALQVRPEVTYAVRLPTAHPIYENFRVRLFQQMFLGPLEGPDCVANLGELMYQVS